MLTKVLKILTICINFRYSALGNLTGIPGITVNIGYIDGVNLPIGFQVIF